MTRTALATIVAAMLTFATQPLVRAADDGVKEESDAATDVPPASPDAATRGEADEPAVKRLGEVLVTATRREEPLRYVPMSVYVIDGDWLDRRGARVPADWMYSVPGLNYSAGGGGNEAKPIIRGIATNGAGFGELRPTTAVYFGDTPITVAVDSLARANPWPELVDIDRIEILRGPQGNYFGASSMGGAIRILPRAPDPSARSGYFGTNARATEHGGLGFGVEGVANAPVADGRGAVRIVGFNRWADGWVDDTRRGQDNVNDEHTFGGRLAATFAATDRLDVDLGVDYERQDFGGVSGITLGQDELVQQRTLPDGADDSWLLGSLALRYHGDTFELVSNTAQFDRDAALELDITDFAAGISELFLGGRTPLQVRFGGEQEDTFQELRAYSTGDGRWGWLAGVFGQRTDSRQRLNWFAPEAVQRLPALDLGGSAVLDSDIDLDFDQIAAYGDLSYRPVKGFELSMGGRAYRIEQESVTRSDGPFGSDEFGTSSSEHGFTPRFSARYDVTRDASVYVNAAKGYRPGGSNGFGSLVPPGCAEVFAQYGLDEVPREFESDSLWSYELGAKTSWLDGRLGLNAAFYRIDWEDIQTELILPCPTGFAVFTTNFAKARSSGVEVDAVASPNEHLDLELTAAYTDAILTEDVPGTRFVEGTRLPAIPYVAFSAAATWRFDSPGTAARLEYAYVGSRDTFNNTPGFGSYCIANLRFTKLVGRAQLSLDVRNLFDERTILAFSNDLAAVNVPRTVIVGVGFSF